MSIGDELVRLLFINDTTGQYMWSTVMSSDHIALDEDSLYLIRDTMLTTTMPFRHILGFIVVQAYLEQRQIDGIFVEEMTHLINRETLGEGNPYLL